ncbi:MAG: MoxR family ATPase [Candidatus Geothermincolales bacterium]
MFRSVEEVEEKLRESGYVAGREIATAVYLAEKLQKPILVEGPAGVGKTDLARAVAEASGRELVRLQCYEGLDESKALYEWEYSKQLLYTQILRDVLGRELTGVSSVREAVDRLAGQDSVFFSRHFLVPRPLLKAITSESPSLLLIDEVDKADPEFEAFLLELLGDYQVTIPEIGTVKAKHIPLAIITSNNSRELGDALKRRCLHLFIDFPDRERELEIVRLKVPGIDEALAGQVVRAVHRLREMGMKKAPGISETIDWARALIALGAERLDARVASETLSVILKYEKDLARARENLREVLG